MTDPPYGINRTVKTHKIGHGGRKAYNFSAGMPKTIKADLCCCFRMVLSACHLGRQLFYGGRNRRFFPFSAEKLFSYGIRGNALINRTELAWTSSQGALRIFELNRVALMTDGAFHHVRPKPIEIMRWSILRSLDSNDP